MAQQTAVEWFAENIKWHISEGIRNEVCKQAKQMEKEQIITAFDIACEDEDRIGEEYYNETYGK